MSTIPCLPAFVLYAGSIYKLLIQSSGYILDPVVDTEQYLIVNPLGKKSRTDQLWCLFSSLIVFQPYKEPVKHKKRIFDGTKTRYKEGETRCNFLAMILYRSPRGEVN